MMYILYFVSVIIIYFMYAAIPPPISHSETEYTQSTAYTKTQLENEIEYSIQNGTLFGVECSSVAEPNNSYIGRVTWYKKNSEGLYLSTSVSISMEKPTHHFYVYMKMY